MTTTPDKLSAKQHGAIAALLTSATIQGAAREAGISERQIHRWLADDQEFDAAYRRARWRATQQAIARLQHVSTAAVTVLISIAADKHMPPSSRVAAASKLIDLALKSVEIEELEARLSNLEVLMKENGT